MKRKSILVFGITGVFALSIGFTNVFAKEQINVSDSDEIIVITAEEQNKVENSSESSGFISQENGTGFFFEDEISDNKDFETVITVEEQNKVENSSAESGFVQQKNGTGFSFEKVK